MTFIVLVAPFCIATTLITVVVQKTREIGVLSKAVSHVRPSPSPGFFFFQGNHRRHRHHTWLSALGLTVMAFRNQIASLLSMIMGHEFSRGTLSPDENTGADHPSDLLLIVALSLSICVWPP